MICHSRSGERRCRARARHGAGHEPCPTDEVTAAEMARVLAINVTWAVLGFSVVAPSSARAADRQCLFDRRDDRPTIRRRTHGEQVGSAWDLARGGTELGRFLGIRVGDDHARRDRNPDGRRCAGDLHATRNRRDPMGRPRYGGGRRATRPLPDVEVSAWISGAEIAIDGGQAGHGGMKRLSDAVRTERRTHNRGGSDTISPGSTRRFTSTERGGPRIRHRRSQ